jgi:hypothetical protein
MRCLFSILLIIALAIEPISNWPVLTIFNHRDGSNNKVTRLTHIDLQKEIPSRVQSYYKYAENLLKSQAFNCYNYTCTACLHMDVPRVKLNDTGIATL